MKDTGGNEGINRLARALQGRMHDVNRKPPAFDFGEIQEGMSLLTNYFPVPIPQGDYWICRSVALGGADEVFSQTQQIGKSNSGEHMHGTHGQHPHGGGTHGGHLSGDGAHSHPGSEGAHLHPAEGGEMQHIHDVLLGSKFRGLQPGDRVLVAWVGNDACVIDIIYPATVIG